MNISDPLQTILIILTSFVAGLIVGKIISSKKFNDLLLNMHIDRTTNDNVWDEILTDGVWLRVFMKDRTSYMGQYRYGENFEREPIIVLSRYQYLDVDSSVITDCSSIENELIMINTKDFDRIEIAYN